LASRAKGNKVLAAGEAVAPAKVEAAVLGGEQGKALAKGQVGGYC